MHCLNLLTPPPLILAPTEQKLHILRRQLLHGNLVVVDRPVDHVGLLLLQHHHPALDRVLDAQPRDDTRPFLPDAVAAVGGLPFGGGVPPSSLRDRVSIACAE